MAFRCRPAKGLELVISDGLKAMFGHQLEALQLRSNYPFSLGLVVQLQRFHSLAVQGWSGMSTLLRSLFTITPFRHS